MTSNKLNTNSTSPIHQTIIKHLWLFWIALVFVSQTTNSFAQDFNHTPIERIERTLAIIERNYYDPARIHPDKMLREGFDALTNKVPELLITLPPETTQITLSLAGQEKVIPTTKPTSLYEMIVPIARVYEFLKQNYKGDIEWQDLEYAFINGVLKTLDPHSNLLTAKVFEEFKTQTSGEYGGIGIVIGTKDDELTVIAPLEGTPAAKAGLLTDDKILEIDSLPTINMPLSEAVERLRGKVNSKVHLLLKRKNKEPWEVTLTRQIISIISVRSKKVTLNNKNVGVVSIRSFQEETFVEMEKALYAMLQGEVPLSGIVLDLRNNPGGLLDQSLEMADKFLSRGDLLYTVGGDNSQEEVSQAMPSSGDILNIPMVVLINQGSASASEIVAGALRNNNRALVMGSRSFGKGSVQSLFPLRDGSSIKLTIAQYLTPGKISIQAVGIAPDIELVPATLSKDGFDLIEDQAFGEESLDEHLENASYIKKTKPVFKVRYLQEAPPEEKESEYTQKIDETKDYPLATAIKILTSVNGTDRSLLIPQALPLLVKEALNQDKVIAQALQKEGISWTQQSATTTKAPQAVFESFFSHSKTNQKITELKAGDEVLWTLAATNKGATDIARLVGVVEAENPLTNNREFVFGNLKPGESRKAQVTIKIPEETHSFVEDTTIHFLTDNKQEIPPLKLPVPIIEKPRPELAYLYDLKDDGTEGSRGNNNKIPEKGEKITLLFTIKNLGAAQATEVTLNLKNVEGDGIFLREGRALTGSIPAKGQAQAKMSFEIGTQFKKEVMKLDLSVIEKSTKSGLTDTLTLPIKNTTTPIKPPLGSLLQMPSIILGKMDLHQNKSHLELEATIHDDQQVMDTSIFVNGKKVFYKANSESTRNKMALSSSLPLEEGINIIQIQSRDERQFIGRKTMTLMGPQKKKEWLPPDLEKP